MNTQRLLAGTLAMIMVASMVFPVYAQSSLDGSNTGSVKPAATTQQSVYPIVDCNVDTGDIVAIDISKANFAAHHTTLLDELVNQGFIVREVDISTQGIPSCIVKLYITPNDFNLCVPTDYTAVEGALIAGFVTNGGGLLVLNERDACQATDEITLALGETPNNNNENFVHIAGTNYDQNNPAVLFSQVNSWDFNDGTDYQPSVDAVATDGVFPAGDPTMIVKENGKGCAIIAGDSNFLDNGGIGLFDNLQLGVNSFDFLNECIEPFVGGGELLPINTTALLVAGAQTNAVWIMSALAVIGSVAFGALYLKTRRN